MNWYLDDIKQPCTQSAPRPFGQVPVIEDNGKVIFESGALLLHLASKYDLAFSSGKHTSWVVWANSCLDPICFKEDGNGRVLGTALDKPNRFIAVLEEGLSKQEFMADDNVFSVADVAVASYLLYVALFFPSCNLSNTLAICSYMARCAARPCFRSAFGDGHAVLAARTTAE